MRVVHSRKKIYETDYAFEDKFVLVTWMLSAIKWKELGNEVVMYTDIATLTKMKEFHMDELYDEINIKFIDNVEDINLVNFWACPKILSLKKELECGFNPIISDTDVVPISNFMRLFDQTDVTVWSNKEYVEFEEIYPKIENLSLPKGYKLPSWFCGRAKPLNTAILHFKKTNVAEFYVNESMKFMLNNLNDKHNTTCQCMCNAEQRMLGEIVKYQNLSYNTVQPFREGILNSNALHTHGYKQLFGGIESEKKNLWILNLLKMMKESNPKYFNKIINHPLFEYERKRFNKGDIAQCKALRGIKIYN